MKKKKAHIDEKIVSAACQGWWRSSGRLQKQTVLRSSSVVKPWHAKGVQKQERNRAEEASPCSEVVELSLAQEGGQICTAHAYCATEGDQLREARITFLTSLTWDLTVTSTLVNPLPLLR